MVDSAYSLDILNEVIIIIQDMGLKTPEMDEETLIVHELGFNSRQLTTLFSEIEQTFGVPIPFDENFNLGTLGDLVGQIVEAVKYVNSLLDVAPHGVTLH